MFKLFNKKDAKCYVFYTFNFDRSLSIELFKFVQNYFNGLSVTFESAGFYNESYNEVYGKMGKTENKLFDMKAAEIVHFSLDDADARSEEREISIEFHITRPVTLTISLVDSVKLNFNLKEFTRSILQFFDVQYGFCYQANMNGWITAFALGDWDHSKSIDPLFKGTRKELDNWLRNCEKIQHGLLRGVYAENLIRESLLTKNYASNFKNIVANNGLGEIEQIQQELYLWTLNKSQIFSAKQLLQGCLV